MSQILDKVEDFVSPMTIPVGNFIGTFTGTLVMVVIAVVGMRGGLPKMLQESVLFKALTLVVLLYGYNGKFVQSALMVAVVLAIYNLFVAKTGKAFELYTDLYAPTVVPEQCRSILFSDIMTAYKDNMDHLLDDLVRVGLPKNIKLNDEYAPLIATYLLKLGNDVCVKA